MTDLYVPHGRYGSPGIPIDPARCRAQTYEPASRTFHQCSRKKAVEVDGIGYCKQHSPEGVAKREAAFREKLALERRRGDLQWKRPLEYRDTLRLIAAGHNDPRALAADALAKWGDAE